jgi:hypothetical protein
MKKVLLLGALLGMFSTFAQPVEEKKEEVEIEIQGNKVIIETDDPSALSAVDLNKIIADVYRKAAEIEKQRALAHERISKQLAAGEITEEEAEELREQANERAEASAEVLEDAMEVWGESYESRWEAWAEEYEAKMEAWEDEVEARTEAGQPAPPMPPLPPMPSMGAPGAPNGKTLKEKSDSNKTVIINEDGIIIRRKGNSDEPFALRFEDLEDNEDQEGDEDDEDKKNFDRTEFYTDIFFLGFNQQLTNGGGVIDAESDEALNFWKSTSFAFGMGWKTRIGNPYSKLHIKYGVELSAHNFRLTGNNQIGLSQDSLNPGVVFNERAGVTSFDKSKYYISYFNIPVMLQLDFSEVGERDESFTLGVGGYAGIRMKAKRELTYSTVDFKEVEEKSYADFYTNNIRYGAMAQVGWDAFKITASYDINPFFEEGRGPSYNMFNLAFGFTL